MRAPGFLRDVHESLLFSESARKAIVYRFGGDGVVVTLEEMKNYLRVDFDDDDALLGDIIYQSQQICMDVARISDTEAFEKHPVSKIAVMYAVAFLYEHREEADHKELTMSLRALLFGIREPGF